MGKPAASHAHHRFTAIIALTAIPREAPDVRRAGPDVRYRASEDVDVVAHVMSRCRDEDHGEQHKRQPGSGHGTDYRFGENVGFRVMVEHDRRDRVDRTPTRSRRGGPTNRKSP